MHFVYAFKKRGWSTVGTKPNIDVPPKEKKFTIVGAISGQGTCLLDMHTPIGESDNFNSTKFKRFITNLTRILTDYSDQNDVMYDAVYLVMDNAGFHKYGDMTAYWDSGVCPFTVLFTPAYSPVFIAI